MFIVLIYVAGPKLPSDLVLRQDNYSLIVSWQRDDQYSAITIAVIGHKGSTQIRNVEVRSLTQHFDFSLA